MSIPLTLGLPDRPDPQALVAGLLLPRCASVDADLFSAVSCGPPVIAASVLARSSASVDLGRVIVHLDIDPDELRERSATTYETVRFHLDASEEHLPDATALRVPSPLVIFTDSGSLSALDTVTTIVDAHRTPGISASATPRQVADILAVVAHAEVGFTARARSGEQVVSILAATVAALRGDDIPAALAEPNLRALAALRPEAAAAVRSVLLGIEVDDAEEAHGVLVDAGLFSAGLSSGAEPNT